MNSRKWSDETHRALMSMGIVKSFSFEDLRVGNKWQKQARCECTVEETVCGGSHFEFEAEFHTYTNNLYKCGCGP